MSPSSLFDDATIARARAAHPKADLFETDTLAGPIILRAPTGFEWRAHLNQPPGFDSQQALALACAVEPEPADLKARIERLDAHGVYFRLYAEIEEMAGAERLELRPVADKPEAADLAEAYAAFRAKSPTVRAFEADSRTGPILFRAPTEKEWREHVALPGAQQGPLISQCVLFPGADKLADWRESRPALLSSIAAAIGQITAGAERLRIRKL